VQGRRGCWLPAACLAGIVFLLAATPARAFTFFDGRLEVHGYVAGQVRTLAKDLSFDEQWDVAQWYNIVNVELEAKPFPNGVGPVEILEFYVRAEARYDCVWTRACGIFPSVNTYGDRAERLPNRLIDGDSAGFTGTLRNGDTRRASNVDRNNYLLSYRDAPQRELHEPLRFDQLPGIVSLFGNGSGPNEVFEPLLAGLSDDPPSSYFDSILKRCKFGVRNSRGGENGQIFDILGPWNPGCEIDEIGSLRFKANPLSRAEFLSVLAGVDGIPNTGDECTNPRYANPPQQTGCPGDPNRAIIAPTGRGATPFRAVPFYTASDRGAGEATAQGLYLPSAGLVREIKGGKLDSIDQNFSEAELAWNRGSSQHDEKELKEAYADIEMFEGRLWMRLGKQAIVWGKTELFRNTDQFNPQDFALASLPGLEESRISLWAARGTWSFYNFGKIEDVRLELAVNLDDFEPADLGRCGEPFAVELVCGITFGYFAHGFAGAGLAGQDKPPAPWENASGIEAGARLEWRYGRFSFQLSDFYGYDDFPYPRRISTYEHNVDPNSGRPRRAGHHGACRTGAEPACLGVPNGVLVDAAGDPIRKGDSDEDGVPDTLYERGDPLWKTGDLVINPAQQADALQNHSANQTAFAFSSILCGTAGNNADPSLCSWVSLNGKEGPGAVVSTLANGASAFFAGSRSALQSGFNNGFLCTLIIGTSESKSQSCVRAVIGTLTQLNVDLSDCGTQVPNTALPCAIPGGANLGVFSDGGDNPFQSPSLNPDRYSVALGASLTPEQEALLGCGPFYQSDCDVDGVDFLNADASVIIQSWPGFEGTRGSVDTYDLRDTSYAHPGTVGFVGGPVGTVFADGQLRFLPGTLGPDDPGYDSLVDGCTGPGPAGCNLGDSATIDANRDGLPDVTVTRARDAFTLVNPINGQRFATELAAVSHNILMLFSTGGSRVQDPDRPSLSEFDVFDPEGLGIINNPDSPYKGQVRPGVDPSAVDVANKKAVACGIYKPQLCDNIRGFLSSVGVRRNAVRAGANHGFGRRDFVWHSGGELVLDYNKRNVLGFAFDFDEERTKSNWGVEATWVSKQNFVNNDEYDGISDVDTLNLTVSVDRPTFINFLNQGRTFFFNSQWFFQYIPDYQKNYYANGPLNVLATFTAFTGYHQDRLMLFSTVVYDFNSNSGALLPSVTYRFTENLSASIGVNVFFGHQQLRDAPINEIRPGLNRVGHDAYKDAVENGLTALRERDEMNLNIRYTF
jgi:hypothetical protein